MITYKILGIYYALLHNPDKTKKNGFISTGKTRHEAIKNVLKLAKLII